MQTPDEYVLDRVFQPAADWFNDRFERSCFWLCRACMKTYLAMTVAEYLRRMPGEEFYRLAVDVCLVGFLALITVAICKVASVYETSMKAGTMNPHRQNSARFVCSAMILGVSLPQFANGLFIGLYNLIEWGAWTAAMYFLACQNNPPRLRQRATRLAFNRGM